MKRMTSLEENLKAKMVHEEYLSPREVELTKKEEVGEYKTFELHATGYVANSEGGPIFGIRTVTEQDKGIDPMSPAQRALENVRKARENAEEPMDCAECGHEARVYHMWHCVCVNEDCPEPGVRCGTRQEAIDGWNQRQNWKREQQAKRGGDTPAGEYEAEEKAMDCPECGRKTKLYLGPDRPLARRLLLYQCPRCGAESRPCETHQEALADWNQQHLVRSGDSFTRLYNRALSGQEIKAIYKRQRAKGGNHLRKGDGGRKAAPWGDLSGGAIHEGDRVHTPDHGDGTVIYCSTEPGQANAWLVEWDTGKVDLLKNVLQRLKKEAAKPKTAPVRDYYGQVVREGDTIRHPNGVEGIVFEGAGMWTVEDEDTKMPRSLKSRVSPDCKGVVVKRAEVTQ